MICSFRGNGRLLKHKGAIWIVTFPYFQLKCDSLNVQQCRRLVLVAQWGTIELNGHFISSTLSPWQVHVTIPSGDAPIQGSSGLMMNPDGTTCKYIQYID